MSNPLCFLNVDSPECTFHSATSGKSSPPRSSSRLMYSPWIPAPPPAPKPAPSMATEPAPSKATEPATKHIDTRNSEHTRMNGKASSSR